MDLVNLVDQAKQALAGVQASGRENWDRLLFTMQCLDTLQAEVQEVKTDG